MPPNLSEPFPFQTLQIGLIGHADLLRQNIIRLQQLQNDWQTRFSVQLTAIPIYHPIQLTGLDGLLITGWHYQTVYRRLSPIHKSICTHLEHLSLWGIASGAAALGRNGLIPAIDCTITSKPGNYISTSILEFPGYTHERFTGCFLPNVRFITPAPNLGILCQNQSRGIVAVRQGNHLASGFVAELTPAPYMYQYWLEMVANHKQWKT